MPVLTMPLSVDPASAAALLKIGLLLVTGISVHLSLSPPNPPAPSKHIIDRRTLFERCVRWVTFCSKMMVWVETLLDALAVAVSAFPNLPLAPRLARLLCPSASPALTVPSSLLIAGTLAVLCGSVIRLVCFRTLGPLFTFELTISPAHSLVTHGPYAIVRHPSYTGIYLTLLGSSAVALAPGSWLHECWLQLGSCGVSAAWNVALAVPVTHANETAGALLDVHQQLPTCRRTFGVGTFLAWLVLGFWAVKVAYALRSTNRRLATEDRELRRAFGPAWEAYAERVPWRLIPGVW